MVQIVVVLLKWVPPRLGVDQETVEGGYTQQDGEERQRWDNRSLWCVAYERRQYLQKSHTWIDEKNYQTKDKWPKPPVYCSTRGKKSVFMSVMFIGQKLRDLK